MNKRTQSACAAHIRTAVVRACIATCSKRCTIYNMALSYSCHSILLPYTNRVQCSGHNCAHAGVPLGARGSYVASGVVRLSNTYLRFRLRAWSCTCVAFVSVCCHHRILSRAWILGCAAFHVLVCVHACVCVVSLSTKAIEESSSSMPIECHRDRALFTCDV
jgi:hypothetical protein